MDLALYLRVLWRFRLIAAVGLALATLVALLSVVRLGFDGGKPSVTYRSHDVWLSASTLFVTQKGFPWGRSILDETVPLRGASDGAYVPRFADAGRYSGLALIYAELAKSDVVRRTVLAGAAPGLSYQPEIVKAADGGTVLPLMYMKGFGPSREAAIQIANRATDVFRSYLTQEQIRNGIAPAKRVDVVVVSRATTAELFDARSFVRPIFIFLLLVTVVVAVIFALENLRPAVVPAPAADPRLAEQLAAARRSA